MVLVCQLFDSFIHWWQWTLSRSFVVHWVSGSLCGGENGTVLVMAAFGMSVFPPS